MTSRILLRRGTAAQWTSANPVLGIGELGIETDTLKIKVGNGSTPWNSITAYANVVPGDLNTTLNGYLETGDLGVTVAELADGDLYIPENSAIFWKDPAYSYTTTLTATQPTANRIITFPNATGTVALTSDITSAVTNLINAAPSALDTLNELAAAINNDSSFSTTVNNLLNGKVSKSGGDTITAATASTKGLIVKGDASQTANLQEWQNSSGTVLAKVDSAGKITSNIQSSSAISEPLVLQNSATGVGTGTKLTMNYGGQNYAAIESAYLTSPGAGGAYLAIKTNHQASALTTKLLIDNNGTVTVNGFVAGAQGLIVKGAASQSADLQQWQNSAGTVLAYITKDGSFQSSDKIVSGRIFILQDGGTPTNGGQWSKYYIGWNSGIAIFPNGPVGNIVPFTIKGAASQTADLQQWQNSEGTTNLSIGATYSDGTGAYTPIKISSSGGGEIKWGNNTVWAVGKIVGQTNVMYPYSADRTALIVRGLSSQTADLQQWQNSAGTVNARIDTYGTFQNGTAGNYGSWINVQPALATDKGIVIRGHASQSANLQEWQNSSGTILSAFSSSGRLAINTSSDAGGRALYVVQPNGGYGAVFEGAGTVQNVSIYTASGQVGLLVSGSASQTANLQEWQNSAGTILAKVTAEGVLDAPLVTNAQASSYTLVLADSGKMIEINNASGVTLTVPTNASVAYAIGTQINILQTGAGQITIAGAGGVTVNATPGLKLRTQWSSATLIKRGTDTWVAVGDLSA